MIDTSKSGEIAGEAVSCTCVPSSATLATLVCRWSPWPAGEPLDRPEIIDVAADFPEMLFPLVTNGSLLDDALLDKLQTLRNVIPVVTLEGLDSRPAPSGVAASARARSTRWPACKGAASSSAPRSR